MACSFSASLDPSRLVGRVSSQTRYWSCRSINAATAAAQRLGRGGVRRAGAGSGWLSRRSRARCRAWRSAGVIGTAPMRRLGIFSPPAAIVTVTFANWLRQSVKRGIKSQFLCSIAAPFLRPDLALAPAPRAGRVKAGRLRPPRWQARLGLDRASTVPDWSGRRSGSTAQRLLFVLVQIVHVEVAMLFEPVLVGLDRERSYQPQAALGIGEDPHHMGAALDLLV
jgi:hypothetical protein